VITKESSQDSYSLNDAVLGEVQSVTEGAVSSHVDKIIGGIFTKDENVDDSSEIIVRMRADTSSFNNPINVFRVEIPQFWRGNDIRFGIGIFNGENVWSVSN
jgi:hypothetical protein